MSFGCGFGLISGNISRYYRGFDVYVGFFPIHMKLQFS